MELRFFVKNKRLTRRGTEPLVGDTAGHYTYAIEFDREWEGLYTVVVFQNGSRVVEVPYGGPDLLPGAVCGSGELQISCHGFRRKEDTTAILHTLPMIRPVRLRAPWPEAGQESDSFTPSVYASVLGAAQRAEEIAAELRQLLEQDAFRGPRGLPGADGRDGADGKNGRDGRDGRNGTDGKDGTSFRLLGWYAGEAELRQAHPTGSPGEAYAVGSGDRSDCLLWDPARGDWVNIGPIRGKDGTPGKDGKDGKDGAPGLRGADGRDGAPGQNGAPGTDGRGVTGITYEKSLRQWRISYTDGTSVLLGAPVIPQTLADLTGDARHRTVTDAEKAAWNEKPAFDGAYGSLTGVPDAFPPEAHTHGAEAVTGGSFGGQIRAGDSFQHPNQALLRNQSISAAEETPAHNGEIHWVIK